MTYITESARLIGIIVGPIWQPGVTCTKHVASTIARVSTIDRHLAGLWDSDSRSLREAILHATNDGDFQSAALQAGAVLEVVRAHPRTGTRRTRYWTLRGTAPEGTRAYIADLLTDAPDDAEERLYGAHQPDCGCADCVPDDCEVL